jgi:hypothetical protein
MPVMSAAKLSLNENVGLIRTIPKIFHAQVEGDVWRMVQSGFDLQKLTNAIEDRYKKTHWRASFIAKDQSSKVKAVMEKERQLELGITEAIWQHSHAGHDPRPSHVAAGRDKLRFDIRKGAYLESNGGKWEWQLPGGTAINCLPGESVIDFAAGCKKLWRRWYTGEMVKLVTSSGKVINATPNHPIFTDRGWVDIQSVNVCDNVINTQSKCFNSFEKNVQTNKVSFSEIFNTTAIYITPISTSSSKFKFHGDISNGEVDTIDIYGFLPYEIDTSICNEFCEVFFTNAYHMFIAAGIFNTDRALYSSFNRLFNASESVISGFCSILSLLKGHLLHTDDISFRLISNLNSMLLESISNNIPANIEFFRQFKFTNTGFILGDDEIIIDLCKLLSRGGWDNETSSANELGNESAIDTNFQSRIFNGHSFSEYVFDSIIDKTRFDFSGHVYNLENDINWYTTENYIIHNCRCTSRSIIKEFGDV